MKTYTAAAEYEGEEYQDQKTETIPVLSPSGVTDEGLSWEVADGVLTVSLTENSQSTEIPDYASAGEAPWAEAAAELALRLKLQDGSGKLRAESGRTVAPELLKRSCCRTECNKDSCKRQNHQGWIKFICRAWESGSDGTSPEP